MKQKDEGHARTVPKTLTEWEQNGASVVVGRVYASRAGPNHGLVLIAGPHGARDT